MRESEEKEMTNTKNNKSNNVKNEYVCDVYCVPDGGILCDEECEVGEYPTSWTKVWVEASSIKEAVDKAACGDWDCYASPDFGTTFCDGDREYVDVMRINNKELAKPLRFYG